MAEGWGHWGAFRADQAGFCLIWPGDESGRGWRRAGQGGEAVRLAGGQRTAPVISSGPSEWRPGAPAVDGSAPSCRRLVQPRMADRHHGRVVVTRLSLPGISDDPDRTLGLPAIGYGDVWIGYVLGTM
jgi:hypothetical protein